MTPTVAQLARVAKPVDGRSASAASPQRSKRTQTATLTPAQLRFFALDIPQRGHWNQSIEFDTQASFDLDAFARAFDALLTHHEIFRQRFERAARRMHGASMQAPKAFDTLPLAAVSARDEADALAQFDALQSTLDLTRGPLSARSPHRCPTDARSCISRSITDRRWRVVAHPARRSR